MRTIQDKVLFLIGEAAKNAELEAVVSFAAPNTGLVYIQDPLSPGTYGKITFDFQTADMVLTANISNKSVLPKDWSEALILSGYKDWCIKNSDGKMLTNFLNGIFEAMQGFLDPLEDV